MAGMDILCSDKTGTLTLNKLSVDLQSVMPFGRFTISDCLKHAALSANTVTEEPIDMVLFESYAEAVSDGCKMLEVDRSLANKLLAKGRIAMFRECLWSVYVCVQSQTCKLCACTYNSARQPLILQAQKSLKDSYKLLKFVPFNPVDKYTSATIQELSTGRVFRLLKGSPQVVLAKAHNMAEIKHAVNDKVTDFANRGFRSLGLAIAEVGEVFALTCCPLLSAP
jgi:magnesium-transporting ATPase (P-type)